MLQRFMECERFQRDSIHEHAGTNCRDILAQFCLFQLLISSSVARIEIAATAFIFHHNGVFRNFPNSKSHICILLYVSLLMAYLSSPSRKSFKSPAETMISIVFNNHLTSFQRSLKGANRIFFRNPSFWLLFLTDSFSGF